MEWIVSSSTVLYQEKSLGSEKIRESDILSSGFFDIQLGIFLIQFNSNTHSKFIIFWFSFNRGQEVEEVEEVLFFKC